MRFCGTLCMRFHGTLCVRLCNILGGIALGLLMVVVEYRFLQKMLEMGVLEKRGIVE